MSQQGPQCQRCEARVCHKLRHVSLARLRPTNKHPATRLIVARSSHGYPPQFTILAKNPWASNSPPSFLNHQGFIFLPPGYKHSFRRASPALIQQRLHSLPDPSSLSLFISRDFPSRFHRSTSRKRQTTKLAPYRRVSRQVTLSLRLDPLDSPYPSVQSFSFFPLYLLYVVVVSTSFYPRGQGTLQALSAKRLVPVAFSRIFIPIFRYLPVTAYSLRRKYSAD